MRRRTSFGPALVVLGLIGASAARAHACSCAAPRTFEEASLTADLAFEGRLVRRWPALVFTRAFSWGSLILTESYEFEVTRPVRGDFTAPPRLLFGFGDCGMAFDEGVAYEVIASRDPVIKDRYAASICSPSQAITSVPGPWIEPPREAPSSRLRRAARFATAVGFGSVSTPLEILRNTSWNPWIEEPWQKRALALAALLYPVIWILLLTGGFRAMRQGWTRRRALLVALCVATLSWLAYALARTDWFFAAAIR